MSKRGRSNSKPSGPKQSKPGIWSMFKGMKNWIRANYGAARDNKHRRRRLDLGGTADAHYRSAWDFWKLREEARAMDRDDMVVGQMVDRAVRNIVRKGPRVSPDTGDTGLDEEIRTRFKEEGRNPRAMDMSWRHTLNEMRSLALRHVIVDGDVFVLPMDDDGRIKLSIREGQDIGSRENQTDRIIHGVELDNFDRPVRYHLVKEDLRRSRRERGGRRDPLSLSEVVPRDHLDSDGLPLVWHLLDPKRVTQTRGVTAFKSVFDTATQLEDAVFAKLIQTQISSCVALFIERDGSFQFGDQDETNTLATEEIAPGLILKGNKGEKPHAFAPRVNDAEWRQLILFLLRIIGINVGLPLSLGLLTTADTTFHGYRGEIEQARIGFDCVQEWLKLRFDTPLYAWKVREWFPARWANERMRKGLLSHEWQYPGFPYVDPTKDVEADVKTINHQLSSRRRVLAQRGLDHRQVVQEIVADNEFMYMQAIASSDRIAAATGRVVDFRELLVGGVPPGVSVSAGDPVEHAKKDTDVVPEDHEIEESETQESLPDQTAEASRNGLAQEVS